MNHSTEPTASVPDLVREILDDARELVQVELALAKREAMTELTRAKAAAIAIAIAAFTSIVAVTLGLVAIALAIGAPALTAAIFAGVLFLVAIVSAIVAKKVAPLNWLGETKSRIELDVKQIEERGAWITAPTKLP